MRIRFGARRGALRGRQSRASAPSLAVVAAMATTPHGTSSATIRERRQQSAERSSTQLWPSPHAKLARYLHGFEFVAEDALEERVEFVNLADLQAYARSG